jgi:hypothetical protein
MFEAGYYLKCVELYFGFGTEILKDTKKELKRSVKFNTVLNTDK